MPTKNNNHTPRSCSFCGRDETQVEFLIPSPTGVTICSGMAASMGACLLAAGAKGKRMALPNSEIMIHQPLLGGLQGQASDIKIHADHIIRIRERMNSILADVTGQTV